MYGYTLTYVAVEFAFAWCEGSAGVGDEIHFVIVKLRPSRTKKEA